MVELFKHLLHFVKLSQKTKNENFYNFLICLMIGVDRGWQKVAVAINIFGMEYDVFDVCIIYLL